MKIFVTGGAGFIGSNFINYWLREHPEDELINYDALTYAGNIENLKAAEHSPNYRFVKGDIRDASLLGEALAGSDLVVHFAAETHVDRAIASPDIFLKTNILGTHTLLKRARSAGIKKFVHISTDEVFGSLELASKEKFTETSPYASTNPYSASKAAADFLIRSYRHSYDFPAVIVHLGNNYGPFQLPEKFIPRAIINLLTGRKIPIYGDGSNVRNWIYVEDSARAITGLIEKGKFEGNYCVGGEEHSNLETAKMLLKILNKDESWLEFVQDRPGHDKRYALDSSKFRRELSWEARRTFREGLAFTAQWYMENESWWRKSLESGVLRI